MTDKNIHIEIVTPKKIVYKNDVNAFFAPGVEGHFEILANHAPFITNFTPGMIKLIEVNNTNRYFATSGGTIEVHSNMITMLAETIESPEEIDLTRAEAAKERALKRLSSNDPGIDSVRAKAALLRALARIKAIGTT